MDTENIIETLEEISWLREEGKLTEDVESEIGYLLPDHIREDVVDYGDYWARPAGLDEIDISLMAEAEYRAMVIDLAQSAVDEILIDFESCY